MYSSKKYGRETNLPPAHAKFIANQLGHNAFDDREDNQ